MYKKLSHKHIVGYIDSQLDEKKSMLYIFLEYGEEGRGMAIEAPFQDMDVDCCCAKAPQHPFNPRWLSLSAGGVHCIDAWPVWQIQRGARAQLYTPAAPRPRVPSRSEDCS